MSKPIGERVATLEVQMMEVQEGITNFRKFQKSVLAHQWYIKGAVAVVVAIVGVFCWLVKDTIEALRPAAQIIIQDELRQHPGIGDKVPKITAPATKGEVYTGRMNQSQEAGATRPDFQ